MPKINPSSFGKKFTDRPRNPDQLYIEAFRGFSFERGGKVTRTPSKNPDRSLSTKIQTVTEKLNTTNVMSAVVDKQLESKLKRELKNLQKHKSASKSESTRKSIENQIKKTQAKLDRLNASPNEQNLQDWATAQKRSLDQQISAKKIFIDSPTKGNFHPTSQKALKALQKLNKKNIPQALRLVLSTLKNKEIPKEEKTFILNVFKQQTSLIANLYKAYLLDQKEVLETLNSDNAELRPEKISDLLQLRDTFEELKNFSLEETVSQTFQALFGSQFTLTDEKAQLKFGDETLTFDLQNRLTDTLDETTGHQVIAALLKDPENNSETLCQFLQLDMCRDLQEPKTVIDFIKSLKTLTRSTPLEPDKVQAFNQSAVELLASDLKHQALLDTAKAQILNQLKEQIPKIVVKKNQLFSLSGAQFKNKQAAFEKLNKRLEAYKDLLTSDQILALSREIMPQFDEVLEDSLRGKSQNEDNASTCLSVVKHAWQQTTCQGLQSRLAHSFCCETAETYLKDAFQQIDSNGLKEKSKTKLLQTSNELAQSNLEKSVENYFQNQKITSEFRKKITDIHEQIQGTDHSLTLESLNKCFCETVKAAGLGIDIFPTQPEIPEAFKKSYLESALASSSTSLANLNLFLNLEADTNFGSRADILALIDAQALSKNWLENQTNPSNVLETLMLDAKTAATLITDLNSDRLSTLQLKAPFDGLFDHDDLAAFLLLHKEEAQRFIENKYPRTQKKPTQTSDSVFLQLLDAYDSAPSQLALLSLESKLSTMEDGKEKKSIQTQITRLKTSIHRHNENLSILKTQLHELKSVAASTLTEEIDKKLEFLDLCETLIKPPTTQSDRSFLKKCFKKLFIQSKPLKVKEKIRLKNLLVQCQQSHSELPIDEFATLANINLDQFSVPQKCQPLLDAFLALDIQDLDQNSFLNERDTSQFLQKFSTQLSLIGDTLSLDDLHTIQTALGADLKIYYGYQQLKSTIDTFIKEKKSLQKLQLQHLLDPKKYNEEISTLTQNLEQSTSESSQRRLKNLTRLTNAKNNDAATDFLRNLLDNEMSPLELQMFTDSGLVENILQQELFKDHFETYMDDKALFPDLRDVLFRVNATPQQIKEFIAKIESDYCKQFLQFMGLASIHIEAKEETKSVETLPPQSTLTSPLTLSTTASLAQDAETYSDNAASIDLVDICSSLPINLEEDLTDLDLQAVSDYLVLIQTEIEKKSLSPSDKERLIKSISEQFLKSVDLSNSELSFDDPESCIEFLRNHPTIAWPRLTDTLDHVKLFLENPSLREHSVLKTAFEKAQEQLENFEKLISMPQMRQLKKYCKDHDQDFNHLVRDQILANQANFQKYRLPKKFQTTLTKLRQDPIFQQCKQSYSPTSIETLKLLMPHTQNAECQQLIFAFMASGKTTAMETNLSLDLAYLYNKDANVQDLSDFRNALDLAIEIKSTRDSNKRDLLQERLSANPVNPPFRLLTSLFNQKNFATLELMSEYALIFHMSQPLNEEQQNTLFEIERELYLGNNTRKKLENFINDLKLQHQASFQTKLTEACNLSAYNAHNFSSFNFENYLKYVSSEIVAHQGGINKIAERQKLEAATKPTQFPLPPLSAPCPITLHTPQIPVTLNGSLYDRDALLRAIAIQLPSTETLRDPKRNPIDLSDLKAIILDYEQTPTQALTGDQLTNLRQYGKKRFMKKTKIGPKLPPSSMKEQAVIHTSSQQNLQGGISAN